MSQSREIDRGREGQGTRFPVDARALFAVSTGRVGTQSLARLLALSPGIHAIHETSPPLLGLTRSGFARRASEFPAGVEGFLDARGTQFADVAAGRIYVETSHRVGYLARALAEALPQSRYVHLHRHPGEFVRSAMRRGWYDSNSVDPWRIVPKRSDPAVEEWDAMSPFEKLCWYWARVNRFGLELSSERRHRVLRLGFDELYRGGDGSLRLFAFLDLPVPQAEAVSGALAIRHNAQRTGRFPQFRFWPENLKRTLRERCGEVADELGYPV